MKTKIIFALLAFSMLANAQQKKDVEYCFVSGGFDLRNATFGTEPTNDKPQLDYLIKVGARYKHVEVLLTYENFPAIDYQKYAGGVNGVFELRRKWDLALGLEVGSIIRMANSNWFTHAVNAELRYELSEYWEISAQAVLQHRADRISLYRETKRYVPNGYINIIYKLN